MSTTKRPRTSRPVGPQRSSSPGEPPASKRRKPSHVPDKPNGLAFLVDENKRTGKTVHAKLTNDVSRSNVPDVDESHAILAQNGASGKAKQEVRKVVPEKEVIDISSGEEDSSELEEDDDDIDAETNANAQLQVGAIDQPITNGHLSDSHNDETQLQLQGQAAGAAEDVDMGDSEVPVDDTQEPASFGEMLQARHPGPIDVRRTLQETDPYSQALAGAPEDIVIPTGHSLRTALSQALKNNDKSLLESCFSVMNPTSIRATIQRLKSREVAILLERIAERIHRSPGRTGPLMVWVQWALVDHGGYLANQPELMSKLRQLSQVVRERASGLLPLLHLKGKLDLLCAQLQHRRDLQASSRAINMADLDDERGVLYIEGDGDDWSESDDAAEGEQEQTQGRRRKQLEQPVDNGDSEDEIVANGVSHDVEGDSSADGDDGDDSAGESNDLLDIEAEEGSEDDEDASSDEEALSEDEEVDDESVASSGIVVAQPKLKTLNRKR